MILTVRLKALYNNGTPHVWHDIGGQDDKGGNGWENYRGR